MWFPVHFRFLAHSLTTFGRWGCGEQINLSHVVGNFIVVLLEMSRLVAPETRSQNTQTHETGFKMPVRGMEGAKTLTEAQEVRRAEAPRQRVAVVTGTTGQRPAPLLAQPHGTGSYWLVGGRRPSVLQRWGSGVLPDGFRLRPRAAGTVLLEGSRGGVAAPCKARCAKSSVARCSHNG